MRHPILLACAIVVFGLPIAAGLTRPELFSEADLGPHTPNLENGRTMFLAGGCSSCHATPDQDDFTRLGGGRELKSDFGTFRVRNISPDMKDGIGGWTEAQFVSAMLKGASPAREHYYPAFPYTAYQRMSAADARDLFAYIKTLPAVQGHPPGHDLPFPFNLRPGIGLWKYRYLDRQPFRQDASKSAQWNRGAYLVEALGHCAECHSPRDLFGGIVREQRYAGGPNPTGEGSVPNITQHPDGLSDWSEGDIEYFLETGQTPGGESMSGDMRAVIRNTAQLSADDRKAMALYLKSLPALSTPRRN